MLNSTPPPLTENDELWNVAALSPDTTRLPFVIAIVVAARYVVLVLIMSTLPPDTVVLQLVHTSSALVFSTRLPPLTVRDKYHAYKSAWSRRLNEPDDTVINDRRVRKDENSDATKLPPWTEMPLVGPSDSVAVDENTKLPPVTFTIELLASCITDPPPIDTLPPLIDPIELWLIDTVA